jgi:rod shape determining protein RodA
MRFQRKDFDLWLFWAALALSLVGILLIFSSKYYSSNPAEHNLYLKQTLWLVFGLMAAGVVFFVPLRFHEALSYLYYFLAVVLLALLIVVGTKGQFGAARWFRLGWINFQPSELAKLAFIFGFARYLSYTKRSIYSFKWLATTVFLVSLPAVLILKQPDLGSSLVFFALFFSMLFWAGVPVLFLVILVSPLLSLICGFHWFTWAPFFLGFLLVLYYHRPRFVFGLFMILFNLAVGTVTPLLWNRLHNYQKLRILTFLDPGQDPHGAGYQILQSKVAVGSGGILGRGLLQGSQTKLDFLPMQHTDFIFTVAGEEFGLTGALVILALFSFLIVKGILIAKKARNTFASFTALGITTIFAFQMLVNVGMVIGIMPVTGLPLPLLSYGGSSMLLSWIAIGILMAIGCKWYEY